MSTEMNAHVLNLLETYRERERKSGRNTTPPLLEKRQAMVVRIAYFEGLPWNEVAREVGVAVRAGMYQFTGQHS